MTRYLLIVDFQPGVAETPMDEWKPQEVEAHLDYYRRLNRELVTNGELVSQEVLTGPDLAKVVTFDGVDQACCVGRTLPGIQGVDCGLPDRRCRVGSPRHRDRRALLRGARAGRQVDRTAHPGAPDHGIRSVQRSRNGLVPGDRDGRAARLTESVEDLLRQLAPQVLAVLARRSGDFDAAEDAVQEALIAGADHWQREGIPAEPRGWLVATATRRLIDQRRSDAARARREERAAVVAPIQPADTAAEDDTLTVLFMCCHPALRDESAVALTLRAVGGLTTAEIARAFLVPEATMAQRISRAKRTIKESGVAFRLPAAHERPAALRNVLRVLYLIFNEGYTASAGERLDRPDLADEGIRLATLVHEQLPDEAEAAGLLALMLLIDARRPARLSSTGELVSLAEQDRSRWDRARIEQGKAILDGAIGSGRVGEYQLQAAIAAIHDQPLRPEDTDWSQILALYGLLEKVTGNPVVTLNRAVAAAMADGPAAGLAILDRIEGPLREHHRYSAVHGHLLEMTGDIDGAVALYRLAARRTTNLAEQRHLSLRVAQLLTNHEGRSTIAATLQ